MRYIYTLLISIVFVLSLSGQNSRLANQYYNTGEYEKAAELYLKLFQKNNKSDTYFNRYIESLLAIEEYQQAEAAIKKEVKRRPSDTQLIVTYGNLFEKMGDTQEADKQYRKAINTLPADARIISRIGSAFTTLAKYDLAIELYEKGSKLLDREDLYALSLGKLYSKKGDTKKMVYHYLNTVPKYKSNLNNLISTLQRSLQDEDYEELQAQLYERIQEEDADLLYYEVLEWTFIHRKQYRKAFRQARSVDRQNEENGGRVYEVAVIAYNDKDYNTAAEAYAYITENKGPNSSYYLDAKRGLLNSKREQVISNYDYTQEDLVSLQQEYNSFLDEFGRNRQTALMMIELADFEALYLNNLPAAIAILEEIITYGGVDRLLIAEAKISLADYMLMDGEIWESTLLYSQVDKDQKEGQMGEMARFKNAMLSYYNGDFEWSQEQFSILKYATSRLISNDAIDMAVFIMDNLGLDTTAVPMQMFAQGELLMFQNRYEGAFAKWDSIELMFPEHGLADDILYKKASVYVNQKNYPAAIAAYDTIITNYPEEIRADNALFELAALYEGPLQNPEKAKALYEKLFLEFSGSTFAVLARERFRILRGDSIQ